MKSSLLISVLLTLTLFSCRSTETVPDSVYFTPQRADTVVIVRRHHYIGGIGEPAPAPYYYPMGGWTPSPIVRERVIIIEKPVKSTGGPTRRRSGRN